MKCCVFTVLLPDKSLEGIFQLLSELHYDGVEIRINEEYHISPDMILSSLDNLKELMNQYKLEIPVLSTYLPITEHNLILKVFEAAELLGTKGVRVSLGKPLDGKHSYWKIREEILKELESLLKYIKPFQAKVLFETHFQTIISSPSLAYLLLKQFDPEKVGVIFDPANMIVEGKEDWRLGIDLLGDYIAHVHVKNASWKKETGKWVCKWDDLKSGMVNWENVITLLLKVKNYKDYFSNEDLKDVILPGTTGFIGEKLSTKNKIAEPIKPIKAKLDEDLQYLKELEKKILKAKSK